MIFLHYIFCSKICLVLTAHILQAAFGFLAYLSTDKFRINFSKNIFDLKNILTWEIH
jgi:hypothetical protein